MQIHRTPKKFLAWKLVSPPSFRNMKIEVSFKKKMCCNEVTNTKTLKASQLKDK